MGVKRRKERKEGGRKRRKERIAEREHVERIGEGEKGRSKEKERMGSQLAGGVVIRDLVMGTWKCKLRLSKTKV